ncbi:hypothetical protein EDB89DRAFT_1906370 [Lactarius sanguifluus]|nr:hypothetical protein EDB89DRAFT_1906370 [Lactarius sanguifluus]
MTMCSKQDHIMTQAAKAKDSCSTMDDNVAAQSQSKLHLVAPAEDPGHESPDQARMVASSSENLDDNDKSHLHLQVLLHSSHIMWLLNLMNTEAGELPRLWVIPDPLTRHSLGISPLGPSRLLASAGHVPGSRTSASSLGGAHAPPGQNCNMHDELRQWVNGHKIESQGKQPTRIDLIKAIAGVLKSEQPSKEDIKSIVNESNKSIISQTNQFKVKEKVSEQSIQSKVKENSIQSQRKSKRINEKSMKSPCLIPIPPTPTPSV